MHIVDEPQKFSPSNVSTYTVYVLENVLFVHVFGSMCLSYQLQGGAL